MDNKQKKEFEEKLKETVESEKSTQTADDNKQLEAVLSGSQEIHLDGLGTLQFEFPNPGLVMEADRKAAEFRSYHLRKGKLLTEAQLKAIYGQPVTVEVDDKEVTVGNGVWLEKDSKRLEDLPEEIKRQVSIFNDCREEIQSFEEELLKLGNTKGSSAKKKRLEERKTEALKEAEKFFELSLKLRQELLDLQLRHLELFSISLEEQSNFEKIRAYLPKCVKKKIDDKFEFLWMSNEDMENSSFATTRIISLYSLFIRGHSLDFIEGVVGDQIS